MDNTERKGIPFKEIIKSAVFANVSWILFGNIIHAILGFALNIYTARILSQNDYGILGYATSLITFFSSLSLLGLNNTITKKFADSEQEGGTFLGTAIIMRISVSLLSIAVLQIIVFLSNSDEPELPLIVFCQSLSVFFGSFDLFIYWYRYKNKAKKVAILRLIAFALSATWRVIALSVKKSIILYVCGVSAETLFFAIFLLFFYLTDYHKNKLRFSFKTAGSLLKISYPFIASTILVTIYAQTDKVMLKNIIDNNAVAGYTVSQTLANAIAIIPIAIIEGFRPAIMKNKNEDPIKYVKLLSLLYFLVFWICILYCTVLTIFSYPIVNLFYGSRYGYISATLSVIVWYTSFSYFGVINNIYLVSEDKTKFVQFITLGGALLNVLLNFLLIPQLGEMGAAVASLVTQAFSNFIIYLFIPKIRPCIKIMIKGIFFPFFYLRRIKD